MTEGADGDPPIATVLAAGLDRPESVAWDPLTSSLVCGGAGGQIYRVEPNSGSVAEIAHTGGSVLGVAIDGLGRVYVCDKALKAVLRIEPASGLCTDITSQQSGSSFTMPNYLAFAPNGNLYVSDSGRMGASDGRVMVLRPDGSLQVAGDGARGYTNGLAIAPDGDRIFIVETSRPGISTFDLKFDGSLGDERAFIHLPHTVPDGVAMTKDGRLVVACWRPDSLFLVDGERVSPLYEDWRGLTLSAPTNVCFYGVAMTELAVANRGATHLTHLSTELEGAPVHAPFG